MKNAKFSFYTSPQFAYKDESGLLHDYAKRPTKYVTPSELFDYIKNNETARRTTEELRKMKSGVAFVPTFHKEQDENGNWQTVEDGTEDAKSQFKNTRFCFVQFAGVFSGRKKKDLKEVFGWCVDFDHFADSPEELAHCKDALLSDENARPCLVFTSPSGDGIKAIYLFELPKETDNFEAEFKARIRGLYRYLQSRFDWKQKSGAHAGELALDNYTDFSHCCNIPHDDDARLNEDAFTRLDWSFWRVEEERPSSNFVASDDDGTELSRKAHWYVNDVLASGIDLTNGMTAEQFTAFAASCKSLSDGETIFHELAKNWPKYNRTKAQATFRGAEKHTTPKLLIKLCAAATGRTWEKDSVDGQEAERQRKEAFLASDDGKKWREAKQKQRQNLHENTMTTDKNAAVVPQEQAPEAPVLENDKHELTDDELCEIVLRRPSFEEVVQAAGKLAVSIPTNYTFGVGSEKEPFTLKAQALTVVGAGTSHGKTRFLENLLLDAAKYNDEDVNGTCLFFTLEESFADVLAELVNLHACKKQVRTPDADGYTNNFVAYADAFRRLATGERRFFSDDTEFEAARKDFQDFFDKFTATDAVRIYDDEHFRDVDVFCKACRAFANSKENKLKAVFLDHLGMMTESGVSQALMKTERVERIVTKLEQLSKELNVPFVVTQQLARSASGALKLENGNLADSADVERSANTVVLLWNSSVLPTSEMTNKEVQKTNGVVKASEALAQFGFVYGVRGALFAKLTKRRGGKRDVWTVLDFDGATGKIQMMTNERAAELRAKADRLKDAASVAALKDGESHKNADGSTTTAVRNKKSGRLVHYTTPAQGEQTEMFTSSPERRQDLTPQEYNDTLTPENVQKLNDALAGAAIYSTEEVPF